MLILEHRRVVILPFGGASRSVGQSVGEISWAATFVSPPKLGERTPGRVVANRPTAEKDATSRQIAETAAAHGRYTGHPAGTRHTNLLSKVWSIWRIRRVPGAIATPPRWRLAVADGVAAGDELGEVRRASRVYGQLIIRRGQARDPGQPSRPVLATKWESWVVRRPRLKPALRDWTAQLNRTVEDDPAAATTKPAQPRRSSLGGSHSPRVATAAAARRASLRASGA